MSELRGRRSPFEQGEIKTSPDRHKKKKSKKSKKSHRLPPEARLHVKSADDDDVMIIEAGNTGEEEGGSLTIKPPQTHFQKRERKHKKERHVSREQSFGREKARPPHGIKDRWKNQMPRDVRDAREIVREKKKEREMKEKEINREMKEREDRKREESLRERERLERIELERRRERQMREDNERERMARQQKKKEERSKQFADNRDRGHRVKGLEEKQPVPRSRSRDRGDRHRDKPHSRSYPAPAKSHEERQTSKRDRSKPDAHAEQLVDTEVEQDTRRVVVEESSQETKVKSKKESADEKDESKSGSGKEEEVIQIDNDNDEEEEEEESGDSDSSSSNSDTESSSEDSSDEDDDDEEEDKDADDDEAESKEEVTAEKLRSKFDDESPGHGELDDSRYMMPDSPDMSDVEMAPEDNLPIYLPAIQGCRSVEEFNCLNRIEEGTYGVVYRALDKKTNEIVALKRLKMEKEKEGFPITSLREINTLLKAQHENIVTVREIVVGSNMDKIYIVMDFVEHDLKSLMENMKNPFLVGEVKTLLQQLLRAVRHLHDNWILHRDLKTSNLLLSHKGILKVGDFGLAREYGSPLRHYTPIVVTLWYRAPELLLGCKEYSTHVDMWSVGCIFAEFLLMKALWPGKSEIDQINKIFKDLGTPTEKIWPGVSELPGMKKINFHDNPYNIIRNRFGSYFTDHGFSLLNKFFAYDPRKRVTADAALEHDYFKESPLPVDPAMFPTWPARSEQTKKHTSSPKPPSGGKAYQKLMDDEENFAAGGYHMPSAAKGVSAQGMGFALKF